MLIGGYNDRGRKSLIKGGVLKLKSKRKKRPMLNILHIFCFLLSYIRVYVVYLNYIIFVPLLCSLVLLVNVMHFL